MSDDTCSEWLRLQIVAYDAKAEEPTLSDDALLYFGGVRDGLIKAYNRYLKEKQR